MGFEPTTSCSQSTCATRLRYAPMTGLGGRTLRRRSSSLQRSSRRMRRRAGRTALALGARPGPRWDSWVPCRYLYAMTSLALDGAAIASTVERAIAGDELAFARIVGAYHLDLVRVAFVICATRTSPRMPPRPPGGSPGGSFLRCVTPTDSSRGSWRSPRTRPASFSGASIGKGSSSSRSPPIPPREPGPRRDRPRRPGQRARSFEAGGASARRPALRGRPRLVRDRPAPRPLLVGRAIPVVPAARPPPEGARR